LDLESAPGWDQDSDWGAELGWAAGWLPSEIAFSC
jgi:hypothetical protein